jgi:ABC-2 type transport system permease protein
MKQAIYIFRKEFNDYFISPIAYIVISVFLLVTGWFFFATFFLDNQATLRGFFNMLPIVFAFVIPAVTMRLFSEEFSTGSDEILLTMPVSAAEVIFGKFAAAVAFVGAALVPTLAYAVTVSFLGDLDWGPVVGGYLGALLLAGAFCAVGLLASALTRNQIVAFILGTLICFFLAMVNRMLFFFPRPALGIIGYLGAGAHFENIAKGVIDSRDLLYFLSVSFLGLYGTRLILDQRR